MPYESSSEDDGPPLVGSSGAMEVTSPVLERTTVDDSDEEEDHHSPDESSDDSDSSDDESTSSDEDRRPIIKGPVKTADKAKAAAKSPKTEGGKSVAAVPKKAGPPPEKGSAKKTNASKDTSSEKAKAVKSKDQHGDKAGVIKKKKKMPSTEGGGAPKSPSKDHGGGMASPSSHTKSSSVPLKKKHLHDGAKDSKEGASSKASSGGEKDDEVGKKRPREGEDATPKKKTKHKVEGKESPKVGKESDTSSKPRPSGEMKKEKGSSSESAPKKKKKSLENKADTASGGGGKDGAPEPVDRPVKSEVNDKPPKSPPRPPPAKKPPVKPKKKRRVSKEEEKEIKKAVKTELKKRQNDAVKRVANCFKQEARLSRHSGPVYVEDSRLALSKDLPPQPSGSILEVLPADKVHHLISVWSFLYSFSQPIGLLRLPTLTEVCDQYKALTPPAVPSSEEMELDDAAGPQVVYQQALYWWEEVAYTLVRSIIPDLEQLLGIRAVSDLQGLFNGKRSSLLVPFNTLTWREIARQGLLTAILRELNFTDKDIADCLRGQSNPLKARSCLKLLKLRVASREQSDDDHPEEQAWDNDDAMVEAQESPKDESPAPMEVDLSIAPTPAPAPLPVPIPTEHADETPAVVVNEAQEGSPGAREERVSGEMVVSEGGDDAGDIPEDQAEHLAIVEASETGDDRDYHASREQVEGEEEGGGEDGEDEGQGDDGADEEEEEEEDDELVKELQDLLSSSDRSEDEKRLGVVMKYLLHFRHWNELVGPASTQDQEVVSTLADYPMEVWRPISLSTLVLRLCAGDFAQDTVRRFTIEVDQMCRNTWTCNVEDSEPWCAAQRFSAMYDRLLKTWVLDHDRPDLESLTAEETCAVCRKELEKQQLFGLVTCGRCSMSLHKRCLKSPPVELEDGWFCNDCISLQLRRTLLHKMGIVSDHKNSALEEEAALYDQEVVDFCDRIKTVLTDWGPRTSFPPLLDGTVNQTVWDMVKQDQEMYAMVSGLALLVTPEASWGPYERFVVLEALCQMAFNSQAVKTFLEKQDQKVHALRRKIPDEEEKFCEELKRVGGDSAVLAYRDPLQEAETEHAGGAEGEGDEEGPVEGECCICRQSTAGFEDDKVVLCECDAEVHLTCIDKNLTAVPEKDWFCPKCKAKRNKRRVRAALKLDDLFEDTMEAARNKAEHELFEALVDDRCEETYERQKASETAAGNNDGTASVSSNGAPSEVSAGGKGKKGKTKKDAAGEGKKPSGPSCEYCGFTELELGSPLVYGQCRLETEEHIRVFANKTEHEKDSENSKGKPKKRIKIYLEDKEVDMPVPPLPFFPRANSHVPSQLPPSLDYPVVHERCAVEMVKLRARSLCEEAESGGTKDDKKEKALEEALRISGSRGCPLGEDRHRRSYWRFAGDDTRLLVWVPDGVRDAPKTQSSTSSSLALPREVVPRGQITKQGYWLCYEKEEDIKKLVEYLESRSMKEGPLRLAITQCFLEERKHARRGLDESQVIRKKPVVEEDEVVPMEEGGKEEEAEAEPKDAVKEEMDVADAPAGEPTAQDDSGPQASGEASGEPGASETPVNGKELPSDSGTNAPGNEEKAESDADKGNKQLGEEQERAASGDMAEKGGSDGKDVMEVKKEKLVPVALKISEELSQELLPEVIEIEVDNDTWGEDLEEKDAVKFTRKGYWALALMDQEDELWRGNAEVIFEVLRGVDVVDISKTAKPHKDGFYYFKTHDFRLPGIYTLKFSVGDPFSKQIRPIMQRVEVRGYRVIPSIRSALNTLSFLNISRGGRYSHRHQQEIDIPDGVDDVGALRMTLLQLKDGLPLGALINDPEDLGTHLKDSLGLRVHTPGVWTEELEANWVNHLMEAKTAQEVLEDLILLETYIHPEFIKPWYLPLKRTYTSSPMHMLRISTVGITALHLFVLDKAIHYEKERKPSRRKLTRQEVESGRSTRGSAQAALEAQKPFKRNSRTSRAAADEWSEEEEEEAADDEEDYEDEGDEDDEDEDYGEDDDDEDYRPGRKKRKKRSHSGGSKKRKKHGSRYESEDEDDEDDRGRGGRRSSNGRRRGGFYDEPRHNLRARKKVNYNVDDGDEDSEGEEEEDDEYARGGDGGHGGETWQCLLCTFKNHDEDLKCEGCGARRPASTKAKARSISPHPGASAAHSNAKNGEEEEEVSGEEEVDFGTGGNDFRSVCLSIVDELKRQPVAADFLDRVPVDTPEYYSTIKKPMWLKRVYSKVKDGAYKNSYEAFGADLKLIWDNCRQYNGEGHWLVTSSEQLRSLTERLLRPHLSH